MKTFLLNMRSGILLRRLLYSLLLAFLVFGQFYEDFASFDPAGTTVTIRATGEQNAEAGGSEVWITYIAVDGSILPPEDLTATGLWKLTGNTLWSHGSAEIRLDALFGSELEICFERHSWSGIAEIQYPGKSVRVDLYGGETDVYLFKESIPPRPGAMGLIFGLSAALFFGAVTIFGLSLCRSLRAACAGFGGLFAALIALSPFFRSWNSPSHFAMAALLTLASTFGLPLLISGEWKRFLPTWPKRIVLGLIVAYAVCACLYNQLILPSSASAFGLPEISLVLSVLFALVLCVFSFLSLLETLTQRFSASPPSPQPSARNKTVRRWFLFFGILMAGYSIWLIACYPANITGDSISSWRQAVGIEPLTNWHPVFYTLLIRACSAVVRSPFSPVLAQSVIVSAIWATGANLLYRNGVPLKALAAASVLMAFAPNNGVMLATLWKDVAYAIAMLALSVSLARLAAAQKMALWQSVSLMAAMFFTALVRHNGLFPVVVTAMILAVFFLRKWRRLIPVLALALILIVQNVVYPALHVIEPQNSLAMVAPLHDIGAVIYRGGEIDDATMAKLTEVVPKEVWVNTYNPYIANYYLFPSEDVPVVVIQSLETLRTGDVLKIYFKLLWENPLTVINARLANADINWTVFPGSDPASYSSRVVLASTSDPLSEIVIPADNALKQVLHHVLTVLASHKVADALFFRSGLPVILLLLLTYFSWLRQKSGYILALIPFIVNFLFLFLCITAQDYRYTYPLFLALPFLFLFVLSGSRKPVLDPAEATLTDAPAK